MSSSSLVVDPVATSLEGYVGFDTITQQIEKKLLKRGFHFNVMVVGQSGLGKSTLVNTIFASHLIESKARLAADEPTRQTTEIETVSHLVEENGVHLRLNIVDTPGYGDQVNNENCWEPIIKYIKDQHSAYLRKELTATRERYIQDSRIHCCLFFISPTGHALKPIDIVVLKKLSEVVNVVPVIAKSDSLTIEERQAFKQRIKAELTFHNIKLYPYESDEDDEQEQALNESIRDLLPFAIVGSERNVVIDGKPVRGRKNRYGVINVENEEHCEFIYLRNFLTRTHLQDLIETTAQIHYEAFRAKQLLAIKESTHPSGSQSNLNNASQSNRPNQWPAAAAATASNYHPGQQGQGQGQGSFGTSSQSNIPNSPHSVTSSPNPVMMSPNDSSQGTTSHR
ncbi:Septin-domain-containing protein [Absidia repens]|uniref:Septin-domain-containing protein n=1 Tax=Absidia repens TaxID=90262 RepID=A0A1X2IPP7_9FUNG|nr:Septin-domain-containing protein [Absidia repens]